MIMRSQNTARPGGRRCANILRNRDVGRRTLVRPAVMMGLLGVTAWPITVIRHKIDDPIALIGQPDHKGVRTLRMARIVIPPGVPHSPRRSIAQGQLLACIGAAIDLLSEALPLVLLCEGIASTEAPRRPAWIIRWKKRFTPVDNIAACTALNRFFAEQGHGLVIATMPRVRTILFRF